MIASNSRYAQSNIVVANNLDGADIQAIVPGIQGSYSFTYTFYLVKQFDTMSDLAFNSYGDPTLWWLIADANPEIMLWDVLPVGKFIRIPANG
jgi:nucleoid-associated protein YgaU